MTLIASLGFFLSLSLAATLGVGLAHLISAGRCHGFEQAINDSIHKSSRDLEIQDIGDVITNLITNAVPDNVIQAAVEMTITEYK